LQPQATICNVLEHPYTFRPAPQRESSRQREKSEAGGTTWKYLLASAQKYTLIPLKTHAMRMIKKPCGVYETTVLVEAKCRWSLRCGLMEGSISGLSSPADAESVEM